MAADLDGVGQRAPTGAAVVNRIRTQGFIPAEERAASPTAGSRPPRSRDRGRLRRPGRALRRHRERRSWPTSTRCSPRSRACATALAETTDGWDDLVDALEAAASTASCPRPNAGGPYTHQHGGSVTLTPPRPSAAAGGTAGRAPGTSTATAQYDDADRRLVDVTVATSRTVAAPGDDDAGALGRRLRPGDRRPAATAPRSSPRHRPGPPPRSAGTATQRSPSRPRTRTATR